MSTDQALGFAAVALAAFALFLLAGWRQRLESGGTWTSLVTAAAILSGTTLLPALSLLALDASDTPLQGRTVARWAWAAIGTLLVALSTALWLLPPAFRAARRGLPLLDDETVLTRIAELAAGLGIPAPRARVLHSMSGGSLVTQAWAGGLATPSLLLSDGILHRLTPSERDAVIAHELAHIARRSLWVAGILPALSATLAVVATVWISPSMTLALGVALYSLISRWCTRRDEVACDLLAANQVGHAPMAAALDKIHATSDLPDEGLLSWMVHAVASHPHRATRLQALRRAAPPEQREAIRRAPKLARRHGLSSRAGWVASLVLLGLGLVLGHGDRFLQWTGKAALFALFLLPALLSHLAVRRGGDLERRRFGTVMAFRGANRAAIGLALFSVGGVVASITIGNHRMVGWSAAALSAVLAGGALTITGVRIHSRIRRLRREIEQALLELDFAAIVSLCDDRRRVLAQDPASRLNLAVALAVEGDVPSARAILDELAASFPIASLNLAAILLHPDPEAALDVASRLTERLPGDSQPLSIRARALIPLGQLDEAQRLADRCIALAPRDGTAFALSAEIAVERGEAARARELLDEAERLSPAATYASFVEAKLAVVTGDVGATERIATALSAAKTDPLSFDEDAVLALRSTERGPPEQAR